METKALLNGWLTCWAVQALPPPVEVVAGNWEVAAPQPKGAVGLQNSCSLEQGGKVWRRSTEKLLDLML